MVVKQQVLLLTISLLVSSSLLSQSKTVDTIAFKKDFEKLLDKYGFKNKVYLINVNSNNQKGGQTAFIINNNYSSDTLSDSLNIGFRIDTAKRVLIVYPLKGYWTQPYVATDSSVANAKMFDHEQFGYSWFKGLNFIEPPPSNQVHVLKALISNVARSSNRPIRINLTGKFGEYYVFGDWLSDRKAYAYADGVIAWTPFLK